MATTVVKVTGKDWTLLGTANNMLFENQVSAPLIWCIATAKPAPTVKDGHQLSSLKDKDLPNLLGKSVYGRTLSADGNVIVTVY